MPKNRELCTRFGRLARRDSQTHRMVCKLQPQAVRRCWRSSRSANALIENWVDPIRNGYWLAHRLLNSRAQVYYGDIYNIPDEIGQFDVVFLGMVLPHLREPFYALAQTARLSRDVVIITQQAPNDQTPFACFIPNARMNPDSLESYAAWWVFSEGCLREMLQVLGFKLESMTRQGHLCTGRDPAAPEECLTIVARRVR